MREWPSATTLSASADCHRSCPAGMCCPDRVHRACASPLVAQLVFNLEEDFPRRLCVAVSGTKIQCINKKKKKLLASVGLYVDGAAESTWWVLMWLLKEG